MKINKFLIDILSPPLVLSLFYMNYGLNKKGLVPDEKRAGPFFCVKFLDAGLNQMLDDFKQKQHLDQTLLTVLH